MCVWIVLSPRGVFFLCCVVDEHSIKYEYDDDDDGDDDITISPNPNHYHYYRNC